jgi:methionine sulfoxide reductase heme-binding subunit
MPPPRGRAAKPHPWLKPGVLLGGLVPLGSIVERALRGGLGANPVAEALNELGLLALIFLLASLACTPLKLVFGVTWPIRLRRMLGLFAFFYAFLHFSTYAAIDQTLRGSAILVDIAKRKFITVGFAAFVLLIPLAATSTSGMLKRLGAARWKRLHRLAYAAGALGVVHFVWRVKKDLSEPIVYGVVLTVLLGIRVLGSSRSPAARGPGSSLPRGDALG